MRILLVSTHDNRGGAAKAAYRFAREFKKQGNDVCLYVREKTLNDDFILESKNNKTISKINHFFDFLPGYVLSGFDKEAPFTLGWFGESLDYVVDIFKPDIVNIHWTGKGFVSFEEICRVSKKIPVVWTLHDSCAFSGGSFYPEIGNAGIKLLCNMNNVFRKEFIKGADITFISPSRFLLEEFRKSFLSKNFKGLVINNGIDTNIFKTKDKIELRKKFGLDSGKKYVMFGAVNLVKDPIKGGSVLKEILSDMEDYFIKNNIGLLSFGSQNIFDEFVFSSNLETKYLGYSKTDEDMAQMLSLADVVLIPSLFENYPFAVLEPLSCGIPVVAFRTGGISEIVKHKENGYLADINNRENFEKGIVFCIENKLKPESKDYSVSGKSKEYIKLFNDCIKTSIC